MLLAALSAVHVLETMTQLVHVPELTFKRDQEVLNHWSGHIGLHHLSEHRLRGLRISEEGSRLLRSRIQEAHLVARHVPMVSHHDVQSVDVIVGQLSCAPVWMATPTQHCSRLCMNCFPRLTELETSSCEGE